MSFDLLEDDLSPEERTLRSREWLKKLQTYRPTGIEYRDHATGVNLILVTADEPDESLRGWIFRETAKGGWAKLRRATLRDVERVSKAYKRERGFSPMTLRRR